MSRISKLTPDEAAALRETVAGWITMGRSTEAVDREKAENIIRDIYAAAGRPAPRFLHVSSPAAAALACIALAQKQSQTLGLPLRSDLRWQFSEEHHDQLFVEVFACAEQQVASRLLRQLHQELYVPIASLLWNQLGTVVESEFLFRITRHEPEELWLELSPQIRSQLGLRVPPPPWEQFPAETWQRLRNFVLYGGLRGGVEVLASYLMRLGVVFPPDVTNKINLWLREGAACHCWLPFANVAIIANRPHVLAVNNGGSLHALSGPALAYGDGSAVYAIGGVLVPERIVARPDLITVDDIRAEPNTEVRRLMIERYGASRYLADAGATLVHEDRTGKLWRATFPGDEPLAMVEVVNSTPEPDGTFKTYFLRVPPDARQASEAVAWTFGMASFDYQPVLET